MMSKQFDSKRLRTLTTGRLHTREISYVYEDLEWIIGETGLMTHMLPNMLEAVEPWLRQHITDPDYWDGVYNPNCTGSYTLPEPTPDERDQMKKIYQSLPSLF
jgi:hypothetical protein